MPSRTGLCFPRMALVEMDALAEIFRIKYEFAPLGWGPRMRKHFGYFTPDDHYEAVVMEHVTPGSVWLDVGCGRNIFPSNAPLARMLSQRAGLLVGLDPDDNIDENPFVHRKFKGRMDDFQPDRPFDVVTMRMVAEHVANPSSFVAAVSRSLRPGGRAVVYTPWRWSPIPVLTSIVPFALHHPVKKLLWNTERQDTFPTTFGMNTRGRLDRTFAEHGMKEVRFAHLDDCRTLSNFRIGHGFELSLWRLLRTFRIPYPERCLLGVYEKR